MLMNKAIFKKSHGLLSEDGISSMLERNKDYMEMTNGFDNQTL